VTVQRSTSATAPVSARASARAGRLPPALAAAGIGAAALALLLGIGLLVGRWTFVFDRWLLLSLRVPSDLATPVGPVWLRRLMTDVTALGGGAVLTLVVLAVVGLLLVRRLWLSALLTGAAAWSGGFAVSLLKEHVSRARPRIVPHLVEVRELSFPSGHAASSAVVYLTLAGLATQMVREREARTYLIVVAVLLVGMIGFSRVYLGVHYPSDVLAGWSFGTLWALAWWRLGADARVSAARHGAGTDL